MTTYHDKTRKLVLMALFAAQALVLHIFESFLPIPFVIPGAKLGLANIVTVSALFILRPIEVLGIIVVRVLLASIFAGTVLTLVYSMAGALLSFIIMILLMSTLKENVGLIGISCSGAVFHNIGQLLVAAVLIGNIRIISYLPFLSIAGIITGAFVGITAHFLIKSMRRITKDKNNDQKESIR